jgi:trk system potassium uptake protein TrkH
VIAFSFMFGRSFAVFALAVLGINYLTAMSGALTALANSGPGPCEIICPAGNFSTLPESANGCYPQPCCPAASSR